MENKPANRSATQKKHYRLKASRFGKATRKILGGEMLSLGTFRFFPFLIYGAFLAFFYIANNYYAEAKIRKINSLRKELKEINFEYITTKSKLEDLSKQSKLSKKLASTGISESNEPVKTIRIKNDSGSGN
jgi:cell division protein FtsL